MRQMFLGTILILLCASSIVSSIMFLSLSLPINPLAYMFIITCAWALFTRWGWSYFSENSDINQIDAQLAKYCIQYFYRVRALSWALNQFQRRLDSNQDKMPQLPEQFKISLTKKIRECINSNINNTELPANIIDFVRITLDSTPKEIDNIFAYYCKYPRFQETVLEIFNDVLYFRLSEDLQKALAILESCSPQEKNSYLLRAFKIQEQGHSAPKTSILSWFKVKDSVNQLISDIKKSNHEVGKNSTCPV